MYSLSLPLTAGILEHREMAQSRQRQSRESRPPWRKGLTFSIYSPGFWQ